MEIQESSTAKVCGVTWWMVCSLLFVISCSSKDRQVPFYNTPDLSPVWSISEGESVHRIADFQFTNQDSAAFGSKDLDGKIYITNFFFTSCPSICPKMTTNLTTVAQRFKEDNEISLISFSVTPDMDSVPRLKEYHIGKNLTQNWNLLTGNQADIYRISRESFFVEEEIGFSRDSSDFLHTERCILVDRNKRIRGIYNATIALDMERLIEDVEWLKSN